MSTCQQKENESNKRINNKCPYILLIFLKRKKNSKNCYFMWRACDCVTDQACCFIALPYLKLNCIGELDMETVMNFLNAFEIWMGRDHVKLFCVEGTASNGA